MELTFFFFKPTASVINANYIITCNSFRPQTKTTLKKYFYFIYKKLQPTRLLVNSSTRQLKKILIFPRSGIFQLHTWN